MKVTNNMKLRTIRKAESDVILSKLYFFVQFVTAPTIYEEPLAYKSLDVYLIFSALKICKFGGADTSVLTSATKA